MERDVKATLEHVEGIKWRLVSTEELERERAERCTATRGPRSKVRCEIPMPVHEAQVVCREHMGRGPSGRWFVWAEHLEEVQ